MSTLFMYSNKCVLIPRYMVHLTSSLCCFKRTWLHTVPIQDDYTCENLIKIYRKKSKIFKEDPLRIIKSEKHAIFVNNEVSFRHINVYGFDYDYTLASYSDDLHETTYIMAMQTLINKYGYPPSIQEYKYNPAFPIRGLHFDSGNGYMMKLDCYSHVQLGTVYKGWQQVKDQDVLQQYSGTLIHVDKISKGTKKHGTTIHQQMDLFSIPFLSLLSNVIEYFLQKNIDFDPGYVYYDVEKAIQDIHISGQLHMEIMNDLDRYLPKNHYLEAYLERLVNSSKKLFIITNSGFTFVNAGMKHLFGNYWRDLFDVVIVRARKPKFFVDTESSFRPFRTINLNTGKYHWDQVHSFEKHGVYAEGNARLFSEFTGYEGPSVMYFGDHVFSDLMDPVLRYGWRTGAIIPELEREIEICNSEEYIRNVKWLVALEDLITLAQCRDSIEFKNLASEWKLERKRLRISLKAAFNPYFGSMFRTFHNSSSFTRRMTRYADLYTSSVSNLLHYNENYHFFPRRILLPHEQDYRTIFN
ncbi:5'-nucleotidase domain-containing protein 3 isoform X2 [Hydra vulgaris]|uniref:5'-nucleotidase domain-containing protein 3 isoform X2 n=1 Tax=Hydra vulgaris TaxID=6087 RepID=A0ABM4DB05_HYDVU